MIHLSKYLYLAAIIVIVVFSACSGNSNDCLLYTSDAADE